LLKAINFHGPDDITVLAATLASQNFDPRRDAIQREYIYKFNDAPIRSSLHRNLEVYINKPLDLKAMDAAANSLVGRHDFLSFAGPLARRDKTTIRTINEAKFWRDSDRIEFRISGNGFVHQQVRRITGELINVGIGRMLKEEFESLIFKPVRGSAQNVLSPKGLYLSRIKYGPSCPFTSFYEYN
jgi:tRNA pseudouridine38-40 synthase